MRAVVVKDSGIAHVQLHGDFTFSSRQSFASVHFPLLADDAVCVLHMDFSEVTAIDNAGLGLLMLLQERAGKARKWVALSRANGVVRDILRVAEMPRRMAVIPDGGQLEDLWRKS